MGIENLKGKIGSFAKDTKINLGNVLSEEGSAGLSDTEIACIALASAYCMKNKSIISELEDEYASVLDEQHMEACKAAASIMAMNNVYYRFVHLVSDESFSSMPANLRMQVIGNPGIEKKTFELCSLAVSAINACGMCIDSHTKHLIELGVTKQGIQSVIRIASVLHSLDTALEL